MINVATVMYKDGNVQVRSWKDPRVSILISEPILVNSTKVGKIKSVSHFDRFRIRSGGFDVLGVRERHAN